MSKVKTDNLQTYTVSGDLTVLSPLVLSGSNTLDVGGAATMSSGLTVDGTGESLTVNTGNLYVVNDILVGADPASPDAQITSAGAATFASLTVNGQSVTGGNGAIIGAFGTVTKSGAGSGTGSGTGFNIASVAYTASSITITFTNSITPSTRLAIYLPLTSGQSVTNSAVTAGSLVLTVANDALQTVAFAVVAAS